MNNATLEVTVLPVLLAPDVATCDLLHVTSEWLHEGNPHVCGEVIGHGGSHKCRCGYTCPEVECRGWVDPGIVVAVLKHAAKATTAQPGGAGYA